MTETEKPATLHVRIRMKEFVIPPISDALVLGKKAPIGSEAMRRALRLLHVAPFEHIQIEDDVIEDIFVRCTVLKKIRKEKLVELMKNRIKPFMSSEEVMHLMLEPELTIEEDI